MQRFRRRSYRRRGGSEEERKREREQLGTSWGAQMEQVRRWNNGRVRMEGQCLERWT